MEDAISQQYDGYHIHKHLHTGGEADIYLGINYLQEKVAIRIFRIDRQDPEKDIKRRYQREVKIHSQLKNCQFIIHPLSHGVENGRYYITMPYIVNGSLNDLIKKTSLSPERCLRYTKQAIEALNYMHERGITHRDVTPSNLLLGERGILLSDFGLACYNTETSRLIWGKPFYKAPEQRVDATDSHPGMDQFSLARTMSVLLTGIKPNTDTPEAMKQSQQEIENKLSTTFPTIFEVYKKATDPKPGKRYETIIDLKKDLELSELTDPGMETSHPTKKAVSPNAKGRQEQVRSLRRRVLKIGKLNANWSRIGEKKSAILLLLVAALVVTSVVMPVTLLAAAIDKHNLQSLLDLRSSYKTFTVTTQVDNDAPNSLRKVIDSAKEETESTITFDSSLQGKTIELTKDLTIPANISIVALAAHQITIIPQYPKVTIHIPQGQNVSFLNIDFNGKNQVRSDAFIVNEGTLQVRNSHISGFISTHNGGAINNHRTLTFIQSEIDNNQSFEGGGAIFNWDGTVTLDSSNVHDNKTRYNGGGIYSQKGHVFIQNHSSISHNEVLNRHGGNDLGGGGGLSICAGSLTITDSFITDNVAAGDGGGILLIGTNAYIDNSPILYNITHTDQAGGIAVVYNPESKHYSFLTLANDSPVLYNANNHASNSTDTAVNIHGKVKDQDSANKHVIGEPDNS